MRSYRVTIQSTKGMFYKSQVLPLPWGTMKIGGEFLDVMIYTSEPDRFKETDQDLDVELIGFCQYQDEDEVRPFMLAVPVGDPMTPEQFRMCEIKAARFLHRVFEVCSFGNELAANALVEVRYNTK